MCCLCSISEIPATLHAIFCLPFIPAEMSAHMIRVDQHGAFASALPTVAAGRPEWKQEHRPSSLGPGRPDRAAEQQQVEPPAAEVREMRQTIDRQQQTISLLQREIDHLRQRQVPGADALSKMLFNHQNIATCHAAAAPGTGGGGGAGGGMGMGVQLGASPGSRGGHQMDPRGVMAGLGVQASCRPDQVSFAARRVQQASAALMPASQSSPSTHSSQVSSISHRVCFAGRV